MGHSKETETGFTNILILGVGSTKGRQKLFRILTTIVFISYIHIYIYIYIYILFICLLIHLYIYLYRCIKVLMASKIQISSAGSAKFCTLYFGTKKTDC